MKNDPFPLFSGLKRLSKLIVFSFLFFSAQQLFASYSFLNIDSSLSSKPGMSAFIETTIRKLPPAMLQRFEKENVKINIRLNEKFKSDSSTEYASIQEINDKEFLILLEPYFVHSYYQPNLGNMTVKDWLIQRQIFYGRNPSLKKDLFIPKHINAYNMLQSVLIHEVAHAYDILKVPYMKYLKTRLRCIQESIGGPVGGSHANFLPECKALTAIESSVSTLPEFMHAAGWPERGFLFPEHQYINNYIDGSQNFYEASSPFESFAVNMEFFVLDPQFQCRRPNLYNFLKDYFDQYSPFQPTECLSSKKILISNTDFLFSKDDSKPLYEFIPLDESKLYQIHYFYAGKNNEMMSKFGHGMLRLVFCDPSRKEVGPECLKDTKYHIVASFAAFIGDVQINPLDGVFGGYAAHLFMSRLSSVLDTYNDTELREVYSLPLKLSPERKHRLLNAIYEAHWGYRGNYSFISNNCAIETLSVIKTAFLDVPSVVDAYVVRPDSLFELLKQLRIADGSVFESMQKAFDFGYFYPSLRNHYEASLKVLVDQGIVDRSLDLDKYIELSPKARVQNIEKVLQLSDKTKRGVARLASRELESLSLKKYYQESLKSKLPEIIKKLQSEGASYGIDKDKVITFIKKLSIPSEALDLKGSYGVPGDKLVEESILKARADIDHNYLNNLRDHVISFILSCLDQEQVDTLGDYEENMALLKQK